MYLLRSKGSCPFQYEQEKNSEGKTALAGLVTYLELIHAVGLRSSVERHVGRRGVLDVLEKDAGFFRMRREVESYGMRRRGRRALENKWRVERRRSGPSESAVFRYLDRFHDADEEAPAHAPPVRDSL